MDAPLKKSFLHSVRVEIFALVALAFLIPIFFYPDASAPLQFSKVVLTALAVVVVLFSYGVRSVRRGSFSFSTSATLAALYMLPLGYFISSSFSVSPSLSFFGSQLQTDTFGFMLLGAMLAHSVVLALEERTAFLNLFAALLFSSWIVVLIQIVQVATGGSFPLGSFADPAANVIGRWNDLGLFVGLVTSLSLIAFVSLSLTKRTRLMVSGTVVGGVLVLMVLNTTLAWVLVGVASFGVFVFTLVRRFMASATPLPRASTVLSGAVLCLSILFLFLGNLVAAPVQSALGINVLEVRPSLASTVDVLRAVYAESPIVGSGPNTFESAWLLHRSADIVQTPFWNITFSSGASQVLSAVATGGIAVALAWVVFLGALLYSVGRSFLMARTGGPDAAISSLAALSVLYLTVIHMLYTPSQSLTLLFFLCVGLFLASLRGTPLTSVVTIDLRKSPRVSLVAILVAVSIGVVSLFALYGVGAKFASALVHNQAIAAANEGSFERAFALLDRAVSLEAQDRYYRTAALINLAQLNTIISGNDSGEAAQRAFQNTLAGAVENTARAVEKNPRNFENVMTRALVFAQVVPLNISGAFENATATYERARTLNPHDPEVEVRLARLYALQGDRESAENFITSALSKKADYTDAILLRAQLALDADNLDEAITSVKNAVFFEPQNSVLLYQLGILLLQDENYEEAASAFELALQITPEYANAAFFLAQAYANLDRVSEAAQLLEQLRARNPENETVQEFAEAVSRGENPFSEVPTAPEEEDEEVIE